MNKSTAFTKSRKYEPDYIKCDCGNDVFKVEIVQRTKYTPSGPLQIHFYAVCTECGKAQQI